MPTDPTAHMSPEEAAAYSEALQEIEACRKSEGTTLDLSLLGLSTLPPEISQLTALRSFPGPKTIPPPHATDRTGNVLRAKEV